MMMKLNLECSCGGVSVIGPEFSRFRTQPLLAANGDNFRFCDPLTEAGVNATRGTSGTHAILRRKKKQKHQ